MTAGLFCPFAQRVNIVRHIKGLQSLIDVSIVAAYPKGDSKGWPGWRFPTESNPYEGATVDKLYGSEYLHDVYFKDDKEYKGRYTVPLIWDTKTNRAVNNVSYSLQSIQSF
jgi:glutathionyl-hydroquinone reductase